MAIIKKAVDIQVKKVIPLIRDIYFGTEEDKPIEVLIGEKLIKKGQTLSCAESCTGGAIATRITANSGASKYFSGSAITYSHSSKQLLGVPKSLMDQYGLVSSAVVTMAMGAKKNYRSDFAIATTGNAGPSKVDQGQDVGTVYIAIASPEKLESYKFNMGNNRTRVIHKTVNQAFEILFRMMLNS